MTVTGVNKGVGFDPKLPSSGVKWSSASSGSKLTLQPRLAASPGHLGTAHPGPRFYYMTYLDAVWFSLFAPGERTCIYGHSDGIIRDPDDTASDKWAVDETALAKEFDGELEQKGYRGMVILVGAHREINGMTCINGSVRFGAQWGGYDGARLRPLEWCVQWLFWMNCYVALFRATVRALFIWQFLQKMICWRDPRKWVLGRSR